MSKKKEVNTTLIQERLVELRRINNCSQGEIAELLGTRQTVYARYERGEHELPARYIIALSLYYNVSSDYILGLSDKRSDKPARKDKKDKTTQFGTSRAIEQYDLNWNFIEKFDSITNAVKKLFPDASDTEVKSLGAIIGSAAKRVENGNANAVSKGFHWKYTK